jgi:hypothetical protein
MYCGGDKDLAIKIYLGICNPKSRRIVYIRNLEITLHTATCRLLIIQMLKVQMLYLDCRHKCL